MLTLKTLRDDPQAVIEKLAVKNFDAKPIVDRVLELDSLRRSLQTESDAILARQKSLSAEIGALMKQGDRQGAEKAKEIFVDPYMQDYTQRTVSDVQTTIRFEQNHPVAEYTYRYDAPTASYTVKVDLVTETATLPDGTTKKVEPYQSAAKALRGDVNLSGHTDVSDAVLLARFLAEDRSAEVTAQGKSNADCNQSGKPDPEDVILILKYIAKMITL